MLLLQVRSGPTTGEASHLSADQAKAAPATTRTRSPGTGVRVDNMCTGADPVGAVAAGDAASTPTGGGNDSKHLVSMFVWC